MTVIALAPERLVIAAGLVVLLALLTLRMRLALARPLLIAGLRTTVQLLLIGLVLRTLFGNVHVGWVALMALVMLTVATRESLVRQKRRLRGAWGVGVGGLSMFVSTFSMTVLGLVAVVGVEPWYEPRYAIPLLGMLLGNTMTGISLGMDRLTAGAVEQRGVIEAQLLLGHSGAQAFKHIRQDSVRTGLTPMINAMVAAGLVSLPGMMTGQILSGTPPVEAVKYQILVMFLITAATGFGIIGAVWLTTRRLFDDRDRLRVDRLQQVQR